MNPEMNTKNGIQAWFKERRRVNTFDLLSLVVESRDKRMGINDWKLVYVGYN